MFPKMVNRMHTPCHILKCEYVNNLGKISKTYTEIEKVVFIAFSDFQGTESQKDNVFSILETATICSPFIPDLKNGDCIKLLESGKVYEIKNSPENWNMQNAFLMFKVERLQGGV